MLDGQSNQSAGGVGRNLADSLGKLGVDPLLISAVGDDQFGGYIQKTISHLDLKGMIKVKGADTATCHVVCDRTGECRILIGNMRIHQQLTVERVRKLEESISSSSLVAFDGNIPQKTMQYLMELCNANGVPVWFEPTDIVTADKAFSLECKLYPDFISPNYSELQKIYLKITNGSTDAVLEKFTSLESCIEKAKFVAEATDGNVVVTLGKKGALVCRKGTSTDQYFNLDSTGKPVYMKFDKPLTHTMYEADHILGDDIVNVSGAGDCFASGFIASMLNSKDEKSCVQFGFKCAEQSLKSSSPVPNDFVF